MRSTGDDRGFVLVLVLVTIALLSASAIGIILRTRASTTASEVHLQAVEARALLDAASARVFHAVTSADDPMTAWEASAANPVRWEFDDAIVEIVFEQESAKPDVNHAPPELVLSILRAIKLDAQTLQRVADSFAGARRRQMTIPSLTFLLGPCDRLSGAGRELESQLTVLTGSEGIAITTLNDEKRALIPGLKASDLITLREDDRDEISPREDPRLAHLHRYLSDQGSLATVSIRLDGDLPRERRIAFGQMLREPFVFLIRSADGSSSRRGLCGHSAARG